MSRGTDRVRVAIVGCGNLGRAHAGRLARLPGAEIALLVDPVADAIKKLQQEAGLSDVSSATEPEAAFSDGSIDAVVIATQHDSHPPLAVAAARAGKHVFVEKPLALTVEACRAIEQAVAQNGVQLVVGFQARHCPYVRRAHAAVPRPRVLVGQIIDPKWGDAHWAQHPVTGGGNVLSQGVHTLDLLCYLAGDEPVTLHAEGGTFTHDPATTEVIDTVVATIRFAGGAVASLAIGDFGPSPWSGKSFYQLFDAAGSSATLYHYYDGLSLAQGGARTTVGAGELSAAERDDPFGYVGEMREFISCARSGEPPIVAAGVRDGTRATRLAQAAFESIRSGHSVDLR